ALGTVSNRLQGEMDGKDSLVLRLRKRLSKAQKSNSKLSKRLSENSSDVVLSFRVYESMLRDVVKGVKKFTSVLIELMEKAGWGLDLAEVDYAEKGHNRYALLSYVCLGMFRGFDDDEESYSLRELMQHVSSNPMELLERDKDCAFSRSMGTFYECFVAMASSVWTLNKLALSFDPEVEIIQVESGVDFSIVFMEDVLRRKEDK
ncbi:hypothetical protein HID58_013955, partial [Brassica napus]